MTEELMNGITEAVRDKYAEAARRVAEGGRATCGCSTATACCDPISSDLYSAQESSEVPEAAMMASLGCGNPTALAQLNPGEMVLDLGSGGGIDVLLSAQRVAPTGKAGSTAST
jgi:arsenite methyltransferase